jgi:PKD domain-containing protein
MPRGGTPSIACAVALAAFLSARAEAKPIVLPDITSHTVVARRATDARTANLPYGGGPVLHANHTHLIFWEPSGSGLTFDPGYEPLIETFLANVAAASHETGNVYALTGQYTDAHGPAAYNSRYGGAVVATDPLPPGQCVEPPATGPGWTVCLTDDQLQGEIEHVIRLNHLPTGPDDVYFLLTPNGFGSCTDASSSSCALGGNATGYCGYHAVTNDGLVLYAVIPYNAVPPHCTSDNPRPNGSTADPALSSISHEHSEMVTDPSGDAWIDSGGNEDGDLCIDSFGMPIGGSGSTAWNQQIHGGHYFLQEEWSNASGRCEARAKPDSVFFTAALVPPRVSSISFSAHAHDPQGSIVTYRWFFGDGRRGSGRIATHRYVHLGHYRVILRTTDSWGNWALYASTITVVRTFGRRLAAAAAR